MADATASQPRPYNIALLGEPGVGKTSLFTRLKTGQFSEANVTTTTVGSDTVSWKMTTRCGTMLQVNVCDTAGGERFRSLTRNYYKSKDAIILVYDLEHKYTLDSLHGWIDTVECFLGSDSVLVWALFGNKSDLDRTVWQIEESHLASFEKKVNLFFNVSAKTGENILTAFGEVAEVLHARVTVPGTQIKQVGESSVQLLSQSVSFNKRNRSFC